MSVEIMLGSGEVVEILDIPRWRLGKFLSGRSCWHRVFGATFETQWLRGKGSRLSYTVSSLYRIRLASQLLDDGFEARFIAAHLEKLNQYIGGDFFLLKRVDGTVYYKLNVKELSEEVDRKLQDYSRKGVVVQ